MHCVCVCVCVWRFSNELMGVQCTLQVLAQTAMACAQIWATLDYIGSQSV